MTDSDGPVVEATGCQLYLIGPSSFEIDRFATELDAALDVADAVGFRFRPSSSDADMREQAAALQEVCGGRVAFLIEDDVELALTLGADGVHLLDPGKVRDVRARLGGDRILGTWCDRSRHTAMLAGEDGADYIAFGEAGGGFGAPLADLVAWWSELFVLPCLIEDVRESVHCAEAARAGADFVGVGDAVWQHPDGAAVGARMIREAIAAA